MRAFLALLVVAALALAAVVVSEIASRFAFSDRYSTYRGGDEGAKALLLTLEGLGLAPRRLHEEPSHIGHEGALFLLLDAAACLRLTTERSDQLLRWAEGGNTLVVLHERPLAMLAGLGVEVTWAETGPPAGTLVRVPRADPLPALAEVPFATLRRPGRYALTSSRHAVLLGDSAGPAAIALPRGRGRVVLLSDPWVLSNAGLGEPGNLELAMGLAGYAGPGQVGFDESLHGFTVDRSIVGYLRRVGLGPALLQGLAALAAAAWALHGRRVREVRRAVERGPGSADSLAAMGRIYATAGHSAAAASSLAEELVRVAAEVLRLGPSGRTPEAVIRAVGAHDRALAEELRATLSGVGAPRPGRRAELVGYHNKVLELASRLHAVGRAGRRGAAGGG